MVYEVIEYVLYVIALLGIIIYEVVYVFNARIICKRIVRIVKSKKFIASTKSFYKTRLVYILVGVVVCIFCICYLYNKIFNV